MYIIRLDDNASHFPICYIEMVGILIAKKSWRLRRSPLILCLCPIHISVTLPFFYPGSAPAPFKCCDNVNDNGPTFIEAALAPLPSVRCDLYTIIIQ